MIFSDDGAYMIAEWTAGVAATGTMLNLINFDETAKTFDKQLNKTTAK